MFDKELRYTNSQQDNLPHRTLKGTTVVAETISLHTEGVLPAQWRIFTTRTKSLRFYRTTPADIPVSQYSHMLRKNVCSTEHLVCLQFSLSLERLTYICQGITVCSVVSHMITVSMSACSTNNLLTKWWNTFCCQFNNSNSIPSLTAN
jgi:hypothetical protein